MLKINPVKMQPLQKTLKTIAKQKTVVDLSMEEQGFYKVNGRLVKLMFPR